MSLKSSFGPSFHINVSIIQKIAISNIRLHVFEPPKNLQISENVKVQMFSTDIIIFSFQNFLYPIKILAAGLLRCGSVRGSSSAIS